MDLIISAVEDVIVDTYHNNTYNSFAKEKVKAEEILGIISNRVNGDFSCVDKIYLNMGPGSFTGIRASMALVLGLTAGKNIEIIPFTSFDCFEYDKLTTGKILVVNGFSSFVYVCYIEKRKVKMECIEKAKLIELAKNNNMTVLSYSPSIITLLKDNQVSVQEIEFSTKYMVKKHKDKKLNKIAFEPVYLRLSQAELQKQGEQKSGKTKC